MSGFGFGTRSGLHRNSRRGSAPRITISASVVSEDALPGTTVGTLSVLTGEGGYTFSIPAGGDPDNKFTISGANLNTRSALDHESAPAHSVTIQADNGIDPPLSRAVTIAVTNVFEQPGLTPLSIPGSVTQGALVPITGTTSGSTISAPVLPPGWTLNSNSKEIEIAGDAPVGEQSWILVEDLADSSNSPRVSTGSSTVEAPVGSGELPYIVIGVLGQSNAAGTANLGPALDLDVAGIAQWNNNDNVAGFDEISSDITPLLHPRTAEFSAPEIRNKIGSGDYFVRQVFANGFVNPATHRLLIVPCARGSTGMITGGEEWKPTTPLGELMQGAIDQCTDAVTAAQALNPASTFGGFLWAQGENETNNGGGRDAYMTAFIQLRDLIRAQVPTASNCWALLGSMVPDWVKTSPAPLPIQQAHMRLAFENDGVYFDQAPVGLAASGGIIHYDAEGYRSYGAQLGDALPDLIADPRVIYDFRGDEIGDGAVANSGELLGTFQQGSTRLTLQNGTSVGLGAKCISAAGTPSGIGGAGIEFLPNSNAGDVSLEWTANLSGRQSVTLRGNGAYGFFGFDGYLFRVDADNTVALFDLTGGGLTNVTPDTNSKPMGVTGTTARFRASAIGPRLRFEVSNDDGANWATVLNTTSSAHASGRITYMQGGNGTSGGQVFAQNFAIRNTVPEGL